LNLCKKLQRNQNPPTHFPLLSTDCCCFFMYFFRSWCSGWCNCSGATDVVYKEMA